MHCPLFLIRCLMTIVICVSQKPSQHWRKVTSGNFCLGSSTKRCCHSGWLYCAMLWVIPWPSKGNVEHFIINVISYFNRLLQKCETHIIFERYYEQSTKNCTRKSRAGAVACRQHQLTLTTPLLPQKVFLSVTENKVQHIDLIWKYLQIRVLQNFQSVENTCSPVIFPFLWPF